jgi:hypothetical protein
LHCIGIEYRCPSDLLAYEIQVHTLNSAAGDADASINADPFNWVGLCVECRMEGRIRVVELCEGGSTVLY